MSKPAPAAKATPSVLIFVVPETLTDGSKIFNVKIGNLDIPAVTEQDATDLAEKIMDAMNDHSNEIADVIFE